jgi:hypothetical protein
MEKASTLAENVAEIKITSGSVLTTPLYDPGSA